MGTGPRAWSVRALSPKNQDQGGDKMAYWFENPVLRALVPLALSSAMKGLNTVIKVPTIYAGFNVLPEGPVIGPSTMGSIAPRCPRKRAFIVTDSFNEANARRVSNFLESNGFNAAIWPKTIHEVPRSRKSRGASQPSNCPCHSVSLCSDSATRPHSAMPTRPGY